MKIMSKLILMPNELECLEAAYEIVSELYKRSRNGSELEKDADRAACGLNALINYAKGAMFDER